MRNLFTPKRGLTSREVIALLMMVSAQLIIGIVMLQMMLTNRGTDTGMGVADVLAVVKEPFGGTPYTAKMNGGEYFVKDGSKAQSEKVREELQMMMNGQMKLDGKMAEGTNTSTYLFNIRQMIGNRIISHRKFVLEKKHSLTSVLWEMIEGVYGIEEIIAMATSYTDTDAGTGTTNNGEEAPHYLPRNEHVENENIWTGIPCQEGEITKFHKSIEEKMERGDIEGVLEMVSESLRGFRYLLEKKSREDGKSDEGMEKVREQMNGLVEEKKRKVQRGVLVSGEILREMQSEMLGMEGWVGGMRDLLEGVYSEFWGGG
ncbi:hypothetical protein EAF04_010470 [Stromatinia cepivora]|nr:hypothetical protein EAF04_010470 [Stromatinia cepivora]